MCLVLTRLGSRLRLIQPHLELVSRCQLLHGLHAGAHILLLINSALELRTLLTIFFLFFFVAMAWHNVVKVTAVLQLLVTRDPCQATAEGAAVVSRSFSKAWIVGLGSGLAVVAWSVTLFNILFIVVVLLSVAPNLLEQRPINVFIKPIRLVLIVTTGGHLLVHLRLR